MVSFGNAGVTLGSLLGGFIIIHYGIQQVIWISIVLFAVAFGLTFVHVKKTQVVEEAEEEEVALERAPVFELAED
jgi:predicted MFS family arabinose efflux permease